MSIREDLNHGLAAFGVQIPSDVPLDDWASKLGDNPSRNTVSMVAAASLLFYLSERGRNPKVNDIYDAMGYCSTSRSVGYSDIFARTPLGKVVGRVLMTLGPAMSGRVLEGSKAQQQKPQETSDQILVTLKEILAKLPTTPAPTSSR